MAGGAGRNTVTAEPLAQPGADAEQTAVIPAVDAPLPPYAQARTSVSVPMSPSAPTPPPAYPPPPAPMQLTKSTPPAAHSAPPAQSAPTAAPPSVADAMVEISMPPLAATSVESTPTGAVLTAPAPAATQVAVVDAPPVTPITPIESAPDQSATTELAPVDGAGQPASTVAATMPPVLAETVTCPECGSIAQISVNRRESLDFCRTCDYPLFWTPSNVVRDGSGVSAESLRRLPGQAGRATIASLPCPFCYEPNALSAQTCIRCNRPMHPVDEAPPPPAPVYFAPEPVVVEQPKKVAWWVWALLALGAAALIVLVVLISTGTIG